MPTTCDPCPGKITPTRISRPSGSRYGATASRRLSVGCSFHAARPAPRHGTPTQAAAETDEQDDVAVLELARGDRFRKRDRDRCGARVPVAINVDDDAVAGHVEVLRGGIDDAAVRLVRDEPGDVVRRDVG